MDESTSVNRPHWSKWARVLCMLLWIGAAFAPDSWAAKKDAAERAREKELKRITKEQKKPLGKRLKEVQKQNRALARTPADKRARQIQRQTEKENKKRLKEARKGYKKLTKEMEKEQKAQTAERAQRARSQTHETKE